MATVGTSFDGMLPDGERDEYQLALERWLKSRATKHSRVTTELRAQLSELRVKLNAIDKDYRCLRAQTEDELNDVSQRLTAEYSSWNDVYDLKTQHMEWKHQMSLMTNDCREKRGGPPWPEDAAIELPPPLSAVSAVAPPHAQKPTSPSLQLRELAREALAQSARVPSPAEPPPLIVPTYPPRSEHPGIIGRRRHRTFPRSHLSSQPQRQHQDSRRPHSSTSWPRVEDPPGRGVRDSEIRQREEGEHARRIARDRKFREWIRREKHKRAQKIHLERDIPGHGPLPLPPSQAHWLPPSSASPHGWPDTVQAERDGLNRFASHNGDHPAIGTPDGSPHPLSRAGHEPMVLQLPEQHRQHATPQHRQLLPAAQAPLSMRHSLPSTGDFRPANGGFTPANRPVTSRPQSPLAVMPVMSAPNSPTAPENPSEPLVEINQENLVLRHDGTVYTSPACMVGVPRDKIHPGDQYWEHHWTDVRPEVVKEKECWEQKHQKALKRWAEKKGSESYYYTTKKWVRRGDKIIEFLDDPKQISPYQLLAKKFMNASGGCITSYKTLSCLCETLSELANYDLDIEPLDWMRHRLYEIHLQAPGGSFDLCKILNDFYHDPKLTDLRFKHGHKKRGATFWSKPGRSLRRVASAQLRKRQAAPAALEGPHEDDKGSFTQSRFVVSA